MTSLKTFPHPSWVEIDLDQFKRNIEVLREHIKHRKICLPVKANAYGHGLCALGKAAEEAGVDYLAVAHLQEGALLREAGIQIPILVLGAIHEDQISDLIHFQLDFSISSMYKANLVAERCKKTGQRCRVHLEVDTGMHRTGVRPSSVLALFEHLNQLGCFEIVGIYSHFATADTPQDAFTKYQIDLFLELFQHPILSKVSWIRHIANSGGTAFFPESHLDMVRPSLMTLGYLPENPPESLLKISPCFSVKSKVSYFKVVQKGSGISYGHTYITPEQTRIVTIPIGYGDGYRRSLSNRGSILIRGKRFPITGMICMDQFMVDVGQEEVYVGDEVVLIGKQGKEEITIEEIANLCQTNIYEVLCFFNNRLPRFYHASTAKQNMASSMDQKM